MDGWFVLDDLECALDPGVSERMISGWPIEVKDHEFASLSCQLEEGLQATDRLVSSSLSVVCVQRASRAKWVVLQGVTINNQSIQWFHMTCDMLSLASWFFFPFLAVVMRNSFVSKHAQLPPVVIVTLLNLEYSKQTIFFFFSISLHLYTHFLPLILVWVRVLSPQLRPPALTLYWDAFPGQPSDAISPTCPGFAPVCALR